jgi:spore coat polysaccharide biosynthesis predicted glycosyltransferase SpsG
MNAVQRVVIRVDASIEMGMGHLMRCLSLASALADDGTKVFFLLRSHAAGLKGLIESEGHAVRLLADPEPRPGAAGTNGTAHTSWLPTSWQEDAEQTSVAIGDMAAIDWLVVDHYALDAQWERRLRKRVERILAIDDLADRDHDCDILSQARAYDVQATAGAALCAASAGIRRTAQVANGAQRQGEPNPRLFWRLRP